MSRKCEYYRLLLATVKSGADAEEEIVKKWHESLADAAFVFGFVPPSGPAYQAAAEGFLFEHTSEASYAEAARDRLVVYRDYRAAWVKARGETVSDPVPSCFIIPWYTRAYQYIRNSDVLSASDHETIQGIIGDSMDHIMTYPEWGSMNRTMLRAWSLMIAAKTLPDHPDADDWEQQARRTAFDNIGRWTMEDASLYHGIWVHAVLSYVDAAGEADEYFLEITSKYYFDYYLNCISPAKTLVDFGDSNWNPNPRMYIPAFERAAAAYGHPYYAWAAQTLTTGMSEHAPDKDVFGSAYWWAIAFDACDENIEPKEPHWRSRELLDEVVGKKVMFRSGWGPNDTALMLNYKPDTDYAMTVRDYMRHTIPVHAEKDHHGHSDENAICLYMHDGAVLLHDGGYREQMPNGKYRQDIYHNRTVVRPGHLENGQDVYPFINDDGTHRRLETQQVDFYTFDDVEFSRTRATDRAMGYEIDRTLIYLKSEELFVVIDGLRFLRDGEFTVSTLYYLGEVTGQGDNWISGWQGEKMQGYEQKNLDTRLLVVYPQAGPFAWNGQEPVKRYYRDEIMLHQTTSGLYYSGQWQVMTSVLIPYGRNGDPEKLATRISIPDVSRFPSAAGVNIATEEGSITVGIKLYRNAEILPENVRPRYSWESGRTGYGDVETDARFVWVSDKGSTIDYALTEAVRLNWKGNTVFETPSSKRGQSYMQGDKEVRQGKWRAWQKLGVKV